MHINFLYLIRSQWLITCIRSMWFLKSLCREKHAYSKKYLPNAIYQYCTTFKTGWYTYHFYLNIKNLCQTHLNIFVSSWREKYKWCIIKWNPCITFAWSMNKGVKEKRIEISKSFLSDFSHKFWILRVVTILLFVIFICQSLHTTNAAAASSTKCNELDTGKLLV